MDDDVHLIAIDITDLQEDRGLVGTHDHGEPVAEIPDPDRVAVGVEDLMFTQAMLEADGAMTGSSIDPR